MVAGYQGGYEGRSPIEERDEVVRRSAGTRVTIGLTARCPYGLAACWGGAYEALKKLSRVEAVRPIAKTDVATAELFLRDQGLPDLDHWPEEFAAWARSYFTDDDVLGTSDASSQQQTACTANGTVKEIERKRLSVRDK